MSVDWTKELYDQLDWHWTHHLRPRLDGLTDEEYLWEPVADCWNIRPRDQVPEGRAVFGPGDWVIDFAYPEPSPPPVTTIAWRMAHVIVGVFGTRTARHFGGPETGYETHPYSGTAKEALEQLDRAYAAWAAGARSLDAAGLAEPCREAEPLFPDAPRAALVLHINREAIHHGSEIALLRDLYLRRS
ncbi:DinB family protein [Nonomuraea sp. NPDC050663]|uniref:DinB family protein n=1 Tax=Nonomuraea sp. NPDC050663 TaxID=3364370 RepID=UPI0037958DD8